MTIVYWDGEKKVKEKRDVFPKSPQREFVKVKHKFPNKLPQRYCGIRIEN